MNTFLRHFADYLQPHIAEHYSAILTPPAILSVDAAPALLAIESASEIVEGNRTMQLSLTFAAICDMSDRSTLSDAERAASILALESDLYTAISGALSSLTRYMPLPGHPDTAPIILDARLTPPQVTTESLRHIISIAISLAVQF